MAGCCSKTGCNKCSCRKVAPGVYPASKKPCCSSCSKRHKCESENVKPQSPSDSTVINKPKPDDGKPIEPEDPRRVSESNPNCNLFLPSHTSHNGKSAREMINDFTIKLNQKVSTHHPDGFSKVTKEQWDEAYWDGVKVYRLCDYSEDPKMWAEALNWIFPHRDEFFPYTKTMRGLYQLYEKVKPFKNEKFPTDHEVQLWFIEVVNLFRKLLGIGPVKPKIGLFIYSVMSNELDFTNVWDDCDNPCRSADADPDHCGYMWTPPEKCRERYNQYLTGYCAGSDTSYVINYGEIEGWYEMEDFIPWSVIFISHWYDVFTREGFWGGHAFPWLARSEIGFSIWTSSYGVKMRVSHGGPVELLCKKDVVY